MKKVFKSKCFTEFFAGVGLVRLGLEQNGWSCIWANDISADKKNTYELNFGSNDFFERDIWCLTKDVSSIPKSFLATASFPCTDLSVAGERKGLKGSESGTLFAFLEIIEKQGNNKPKVLMLENVRGFLTSHKGQDIITTVKKLNDLGYIVDILELDARNFTPQSRPRVFVFAVQRKLAEKTMVMKESDSYELFSSWELAFNSSNILRTKTIRNLVYSNPSLSWGILDIPDPPQTSTGLNSVLEDLPDDSKYWWSSERVDKLYQQMSPRHKEILASYMRLKQHFYGTVYRRMRAGSPKAELRTDGIAGCLRTPKGGSSKQILVKMGYNRFMVRFMTPREYARLQGVPDSYILPKRDTSGYFAMGDAVCAPLITWISENILSPCYQEYIGHNRQE